MPLTQKDFDRWIETAKEKGAAYVISMCDTFDYDDYPVYVMPDENLESRIASCRGDAMQTVNEVIKIEYGENTDESDKKDVDCWYKKAKEMGASHIISVCNGFDHEDFAVYVMPHDRLLTYVQDINSQPMQSINEIINLEDKKTYKPRLENSDDVFDPWIETAREKGASHVISVCDNVLQEYYPVYVMPDEDLKKYTKDINSAPKRYVEEVIKIEYGANKDKLDLKNSRLSLRGEIDIRVRDLYFEKTHPEFGSKTLDELIKIIEVQINEVCIEELSRVISNLKKPDNY